jgi:hypothetical protein
VTAPGKLLLTTAKAGNLACRDHDLTAERRWLGRLHRPQVSSAESVLNSRDEFGQRRIENALAAKEEDEPEG